MGEGGARLVWEEDLFLRVGGEREGECGKGVLGELGGGVGV